MDDGWLKFVQGAFEKEYWIHPTRVVDWIRTRTPVTGEWTYSGPATLQGAEGKSRKVRVAIEGRSYKRHRLIALAKDGTPEGLAKFLNWKNNPVLHGKRRREDERPDDTPENVRFGTQKENVNDPGNKKRKTNAFSYPVRLTLVATGMKKTLDFESVQEAATFLGENGGSLRSYLNGWKHKSMPGSSRGIWSAEYICFDLPDAVRLVRAAGKIYLSRERPNELFRELPTGKFCETELERGEDGYVQLLVVDGGLERLHRLIVETLNPGSFEAKLAANPGLTKGDLQVDHIDGDQDNNAIDNLKVVDRNEHARKHAFAIEWIDTKGNVIETFGCAADVVAAVSGADGQPLDAACVHYVCDKKQTHTGGRFFRWKDVEHVKAKRAAKKANR